MIEERRRGWTVPLAGGLTGLAFGIAVPAGSTLLLATGEGLLGAIGLLAGLALGAFAVGLWAGAPTGGASIARRWALAIGLYLVAGIFGQLWVFDQGLRSNGLAGALAPLVLLAAPAYMAGSIVALLRTQGPGEPGRARTAGLPVAVLVGAGVGVALAGGVLIPQFDPVPVFFTAAAALAAAAAIDVRGEQDTEPEEAGDMRDRVVIVTGVGGRGQVGYAIAEACLEAGAKVIVTDVSDRVDALADELARTGEVDAVRADLTQTEGAEAVVAAARDRYGRLDTLINVAGGLTVTGPLAETDAEEWAREIDRNGRTAFLMSRAALPLLRESRGAVVNFASPAGIRAVAGMGAYSAAKATVVAQTRALALEEKSNGVRVNAIAPGMIDTEQNRESVDDPDAVDWVTRDEITRVVLFLASDAASGISGETVHVLG